MVSLQHPAKIQTEAERFETLIWRKLGKIPGVHCNTERDQSKPRPNSGCAEVRATQLEKGGAKVNMYARNSE